jgi:hypothetical protein
MTLANFTLTGGTNLNHFGGGICLWLSSFNTVDCVVSNNASFYGGGIGLYCSSNNTISGEISGNLASQFGGGISLMISSEIRFPARCR